MGILGALKWLPAVAAGKDVSKAYKEAIGQDRPVWLSGRFIGALVALVGVVLTISQGITLDQAQLEKLANNLTAMAGALATIYGIVRGILGQLQAKKRTVEPAAPEIPVIDKAEPTEGLAESPTTTAGRKLSDGQGNTDGQV